MNKKRIIIISIIVILIVILILYYFIIKKRNTNNGKLLNGEKYNTSIKVTGKLKDYIDKIGDDYYIKYSGKFKDNNGQLIEAIVEYTKFGDAFGLRSSELVMHLVYNDNVISTISDTYNLIVKMPKDYLDVSEYNFASDIGQTFACEYKEKINNTQYDVEEYIYNGKKLKYYFVDSDIKRISYNGENIKIIRLETVSNKDILRVPDSYKIIDNTQ